MMGLLSVFACKLSPPSSFKVAAIAVPDLFKFPAICSLLRGLIPPIWVYTSTLYIPKQITIIVGIAVQKTSKAKLPSMGTPSASSPRR